MHNATSCVSLQDLGSIKNRSWPPRQIIQGIPLTQNILAIAHIEQAIDIRRAIIRLNPPPHIAEHLAILGDELEMALAALTPPPQIDH